MTPGTGAGFPEPSPPHQEPASGPDLTKRSGSSVVPTGPEPVAGSDGAEQTAADASGPAATAALPAASGRSRPPLALLLVGLLTLAMVAGVVYLALRLRDEGRTETARSEAVAASRDAARVLFSYDHATLDEDFERGLSVTTGEFREEYARTTEDVVKDVATQYKAVVVAEVIESAVVSAAPEEVETLVFLNQATTSTQIEGRQVDQSRVRMRMVERDGEWLVAEVSAL
jgi:Mce-associated membrane protein